MPSTGFPTLTTRTSYWQVSRAPRYSLLFAIPLLVFYQVLALLLAHGERSIRNGADVILQALFTAAAGAWGPPLFMVCLIGGGLWLVTRDMRAHGSQLRGGVFAAMLGESIALALIFGFVVGSVTSGVLGKIGRASCRERVWMWVGEGSLKKKRIGSWIGSSRLAQG